MARPVVGALLAGLAVGLAIGLTHESDGRSAGDERRARAAVVRRLERAITADARRRAAAHQIKGPILRTRCEPYQYSRVRFSCTAVQFESKLSYTGQVYVAKVSFATGRFSFRPHKIPLYLGI
ncbi:MAG TPA: hypothetical protein VF545_00105 [Thermoleophilaceae bacterium]|jgi:hypothetical protein